MNRVALCFFILLAGSQAVRAADSALEEQLRQSYENSERILRNFYVLDDLKFDASGNLVKKADVGSWTLFGSVTIQRVTLKAKKLELQGYRNVIVFGSEQKQAKHPKLKPHWWMEITTQQGTGQGSQLQAALRRIFLEPDEDFIEVLPDYWREYMMRSTGRKTGDTPCESTYPELKSDNPSVKSDNQPAVQVSTGITEPILVHRVGPRYLYAAKAAGIQGEIGLRALITEAGDVSNVCLTRATGAGLDDEVVQTVRQWKYSPVLLNGTPVKSGTTISVKFGFERL